MDVFDVPVEATTLSQAGLLPGLTLTGEFADELKVIVDYTLNHNVSLSAVGGLAELHEGTTEFTGGGEAW